MRKKLYTSAVVLLLFSTLTLANNPTRKRQVNQQIRISNGVATGELTKAEAIKLQKQQVNIKRTKKSAIADGIVTRKERAAIQH
ncbi:hypothetical protein [Carboxylicivirga marina]|uniref:hypothetical protein n=1 Tax=Carboxylicivirga marina TaxID=2800988 RepID=UPI002595A80A|nr:hypothetical protein [uncultured Carboxylicivirga sp.]